MAHFNVIFSDNSESFAVGIGSSNEAFAIADSRAEKFPVAIVSNNEKISAQIAQNAERFAVELEQAIKTVSAKEYTGAVTVTPAKAAQTLATKGTLLRENIVVNAIPNNYGLITWDGSTLTVS